MHCHPVHEQPCTAAHAHPPGAACPVPSASAVDGTMYMVCTCGVHLWVSQFVATFLLHCEPSTPVAGLLAGVDLPDEDLPLFQQFVPILMCVAGRACRLRQSNLWLRLRIYRVRSAGASLPCNTFCAVRCCVGVVVSNYQRWAPRLLQGGACGAGCSVHGGNGTVQ